MKGFKNFLMQGNVVELAVAVVIATSFGAVVKAMVDLIMGLIGLAGGTPNFDDFKPAGLPVGVFITALVAFIILAAVVYFVVVKPYEAAKARTSKPELVEEAVDPQVELLKEIRDTLRARG